MIHKLRSLTIQPTYLLYASALLEHNKTSYIADIHTNSVIYKTCKWESEDRLCYSSIWIYQYLSDLPRMTSARNASKSASLTSSTLVSNELCRVRAPVSSFASKKAKPKSLFKQQINPSVSALVDLNSVKENEFSLLLDIPEVESRIDTNHGIRLRLLVQAS